MARRPRTTFQALAAVLLLVSTNVNGQISPQGCKNLLSVFTAWGFSSKLSNSVNTYWTNCGCSFVVDIPKGTQAAATCSETADPQIPWSIASIYISNPPLTLGTFPSVLTLLDGNSIGFEYCQNLTFKNNALRGNALAKGQYLPTRTYHVDVSNNPSLSQWPGFDANGNAPYYSFQTVRQVSNNNICCPPTIGTGIVKCTPAAATCIGPMNLAEYENIPNIPGSEVPDSNVTISPTISAAVPTNGGSAVNNPSEGGSPSMSPGNIVLIVVAVFVGVGVIVFGAIAQYTRRKQKPVTAVEDDSYYDDPEDVEENIIYEGRASGGGRASGEFTYGSLGSGKPASIPSAQRSSYDARRSHESVTRGRKSGDTWMTAKT